ncbi:MAG TPA: hypothetical protein VFA15_04300 [Nitrososphaera sp.]|nr:hypothetical protein [Nitrososphaera sp.]
MKGDAPPPLFAQQKQSSSRDVSLNKYLVTQKSPEEGRAVRDAVRSHSVGQIASILLPNQWTTGYGLNNVVGNSSYDEFVPPSSAGSTKARLEFFYRGTQVPENEAAAFQKILSSGHVLSREEYFSLGSILRGKDRQSAFQVDLAWTARHNGKSVLMIEGTFIEDQMRTLIMLIDAGNGGAVVQEVAFTAAENDYAELKPQIEAALQSVKWR